MSTVFFAPYLLSRSFPTVTKEVLKKVQSSDIALVRLCWKNRSCQDKPANTNKLDQGPIIECF